MLHSNALVLVATVAGVLGLGGCAASASMDTTRSNAGADAAAAGSAANAAVDAGIAAAPGPASPSQADSGAAAPGATLPATAPAKASYEVPVADPQLAAFARFEVGQVSWRVDGSDVWLDYPFPAALSGIDNQTVSFRGSIVEPGVAALTGTAGRAQCQFSQSVVRCDEMMTGLATDPAAARAALASQSQLEQMMRGQVIASFSSDPIGVLTFAAPHGNDGADDR
jgi:hypothetical protein